MPEYEEAQVVTTEKKCDNGVVVACEQKQTYQRRWWYFGGSWTDTGEPKCDECPQGRQSRDSTLAICCFAGTQLLQTKGAGGPLAAGALIDALNQVSGGAVDRIFGPGPPVTGFRQLNQCQKVNGSDITKWIAALKEAQPNLRASNFPGADNNQKAIDCLTKLAKEFNWLGEATSVVEKPKAPTPEQPLPPQIDPKLKPVGNKPIVTPK